MSDQYGSDITQYPTPQQDGALRNMAEDTPVVKSGLKMADHIYDAVTGDDRLASAAAIPGDIAALALEAAFAIQDPIYALAQAGLSIVLELVEPLNELLYMVSGDPEEMKRQGEVWGQVSEALGALREENAAAVNENLRTWTGDASDAAFEQLTALEASIFAASNEAAGVQTLLGWAELLAETIYDVIKSILAELVSWLITRGLIALMNSTWSFGASVATFLLSAAYKSFSMFSRGFKKLSECNRIFGKILGVLGKFVLDNPVLKRGLGNWVGMLAAMGAKAGVTAALTGGLGAVALGAGALGGGSDYQGQISRASSAGTYVDPDELVQTATALEGLTGNADAIKGVAADATAAEMTWGLPGIAFAGKYQDAGNGMVEIIGNMSAAHTASASSLRSCAEDYEAADGEAATAFGNLQGELDGR
ncbi:hypothetical protein [Glycomyces artemisiae]|uniref:Uncharacterized protein n=1 Tax=Glycomyces artemisiae TaxID=1076443 RepID=A0A2T0UQ36_9ACTN|nr:hypothetical protein [Glycomyces artemisiae]PRY59937.1 hypothetical protein B0I28_103411 [Glycomyces artemisiae]